MKRDNRPQEAQSLLINKVDKELFQLATFLNKKAVNVPKNTLIIIIILGCFFCSVLLGFEVKQTLNGKMKTGVQTIRAPTLATYQYHSKEYRVFQRIKRFHGYLDSLKQHDSTHYKDLMQARPHLLDSLITLEQLLN